MKPQLSLLAHGSTEFIFDKWYSGNRNKRPGFVVMKVFPHGPGLWRNVAGTV